MPDLSLLFAFWSPEHGANWNLVAAWGLALVFAKGLFPKVLEKISEKLLSLLNKIPFFGNTDLDEAFFQTLHMHLSTKVLAKMSEAKAIKTEFHLKINEALKAKDNEKVQALSVEMREKLEELTTSISEGFFVDAEAVLWKKLTEKYGDKIKAAKWVVDKVKALVEDLKQPDHPSTSALIAKHLFGAAGDLGNGS